MTRFSFIIQKKTLIVLLFSILHIALYAQSTIRGEVLGQDGLPLSDVSVTNSTLSFSTSTDKEGKFTLRGKKGDKVIFTSVGYAAKEVVLDELESLQIVLDFENTALEEVVVMGYGIVKRTKVTASVSTLDSKVLESGMRANPVQALAGTIPGVRISTGSGRPGAIGGITLRGGTHFDGSGSPLILVDGQVRSSLSDINPEEIERIDVQKDAAATAIYGARASNGVIIVTTKGGKEGRSELAFKANRGINYLNIPYDFLEAGDYVKWNRLGAVGAINSGTLPNTTLGSPGPRGTGNAYFAADGITPLDGNYANEAR